MVAPLLRRWDYDVSRRIDFFGTTSQNVRKRILEAYGRHAEVIPAPVDLGRHRVGSVDGGYYLVVSRLTRYKRVDLAIQAMSRLGRRLVVVGDGPDRHKLQLEAAGADVTFLGNVDERSLSDLYTGCKALLHPQEEDYGLAPLEAMASGRPVVAYAKGGACETVQDGVTGVLFSEQVVDSLIEAIETLEARTFDTERIRAHASKFAVEPFCDRIESFLEECLMSFRAVREA
jgi:glycosyltransferase involved in cell wall biosynthesis